MIRILIYWTKETVELINYQGDKNGNSVSVKILSKCKRFLSYRSIKSSMPDCMPTFNLHEPWALTYLPQIWFLEFTRTN